MIYIRLNNSDKIARSKMHKRCRNIDKKRLNSNTIKTVKYSALTNFQQNKEFRSIL